MKTDDLADLLAAQVAPAPRRAASRRLGLALALGLPAAAAIMLVDYGVRRDLVQAMLWPMFWVKLLFPACIGIAGYVMVQRLAHPGVRVRRAWLGAVLPVLAVWVLAAVGWWRMPDEARMPALMGQTWRTCVWSIGLMALPVFVAVLAALRTLAPTRPAAAGAAAGALAGGAGAAVYALHCPELTAPFLAVWYVLGIALPVAAGALIGPRLLRW
ncbi:NrsF family protein [Xenophilus sp.]|uniref:NrsF family protein n=1 Tax=Xenophilus sp. TaxID=1873499 RepID=UPI0037DDAB90